jgi:hypothetical protein
MPWALGIWALMRVCWVWLRWVVSDFGHADGRRVVAGEGRFHGPAGVVLQGLRWFGWSGWHVGEGDDGGCGAGGGVGMAGAGQGAGAFGLAGAVWTGLGVQWVRRVQCVQSGVLSVQPVRLVRAGVFLVMNRSSVRFRQAALSILPNRLFR